MAGTLARPLRSPQSAGALHVIACGSRQPINRVVGVAIPADADTSLVALHRARRHVRKPLHFDGEPDRFSRTRALFAKELRPGLRDLTPRDEHAIRQDASPQRIVTLWRTWLGKAA